MSLCVGLPSRLTTALRAVVIKEFPPCSTRLLTAKHSIKDSAVLLNCPFTKKIWKYMDSNQKTMHLKMPQLSRINRMVIFMIGPTHFYAIAKEGHCYHRVTMLLNSRQRKREISRVLMTQCISVLANDTLLYLSFARCFRLSVILI